MARWVPALCREAREPLHGRRRSEYVDFCLGDTGAMGGHAEAATLPPSPSRLPADHDDAADGDALTVAED
jgi:hypothetical protein